MVDTADKKAGPLTAHLDPLTLGQFVAEAMLSSQRVLPTALTEAGFAFADTEIEPALERLFRD